MEAVILHELLEVQCSQGLLSHILLSVAYWVSVVSVEEPPVLDLALHLLRHPML